MNLICKFETAAIWLLLFEFCDFISTHLQIMQVLLIFTLNIIYIKTKEIPMLWIYGKNRGV